MVCMGDTDRTTVEVTGEQIERLKQAKRKMSYELQHDFTLGETIDQLSRQYLDRESEGEEESD